MHVTHLGDQIITTRGVLGHAIPPQGVAKSRSCEWRAWPPICLTALFKRILKLDGRCLLGLVPSLEELTGVEVEH